ncbi:MAG: iron ABC transporter permease [Oscillospiraceae bacterium]|nr:iron ABC transporter permease [Oscillospiraceae bacterium]
MSRKIRYTVCFLSLALIFALLAALNLFIGSISYSPSEVAAVLLNKSTDSTAISIVMNIRLPRMVAAAVLGGGLSVSGYLLQTYFANPIAGPFVLGISSGAKLTVALAMIFSLERGAAMGSATLMAASFAGSMLSMGFVLAVAGRIKGSGMLIVSGVMIGYICSAVTDFAVTFADDSNIVNLHSWSLGSFSGIDGGDVKVFSAVVFFAVIAAFLLSKDINAYRLGETYAASVGVNIRLFRIALILLSSLLSAVVTAFAGPVSFVGIAVPHVVKGIFASSDSAVIIPASFIGGGVFCLLCDLLARTAFAPTELSISSVTAVFGAPIVIIIMIGKKRRGAGGAA